MIYHLAAAVGVQLIVEQPVHTLETNIHGSEVVLAAARMRRLAAVYDYQVGAAALEHAAGTLAADSALVN